MREDGDAFGLFVSAVPGQPVTRHGTKILIGAERDPSDRRKIRYREKQIVAIPSGEAVKYAREYRRSIADGALREHTKAEWVAQQEQIELAGASREKLEQHTDEQGGQHSSAEAAAPAIEGSHGSHESSR